MALLFIDSFDHYPQNGSTGPSMITRKWTSTNGDGGTMVAGRTGNGLLCGSPVYTTKTIGSVSSIAVGLAYNTNGLANSPIYISTPGVVFGSANYIQLKHVGDGRLYVDLNNGGFTSAYSSFIMNIGTWYYLELQATIGSGGAVSYTARANGSTILSGTFSSSLTAAWDFITCIGPGGGSTCIIDDLYVTDGELLGDIRIYCLYPRLDGSTIQWVPSAGTSHYPMVNEHSPDDLATIVSCDSSHINNIDEYYLDMIGSFTGSIKGVQANWCVSKTDGGTASIQGLYNNGSTVVDTTSTLNPSFPSWIYFLDAKRESVFTGSDWTTAEINGMQLGIQRLS